MKAQFLIKPAIVFVSLLLVTLTSSFSPKSGLRFKSVRVDGIDSRNLALHIHVTDYKSIGGVEIKFGYGVGQSEIGQKSFGVYHNYDHLQISENENNSTALQSDNFELVLKDLDLEVLKGNFITVLLYDIHHEQSDIWSSKY